MTRTLILFFTSLLLFSCNTAQRTSPNSTTKDSLANIKEVFQAPDTNELNNDEWGRMVKYGARLIANTSYYIGPEGSVSNNLGNKMNCTNCHLSNGTKAYGLNFFDSHRTYPQFRARENKILSMSERVNNCIERPHNGKPLPLDSKEMVAIVSYIKWLGEGYNPKTHEGYGLKPIAYKGLQADPARGEMVYSKHCKSCHQKNGEGLMNADKSTYTYPPLWGNKSYQEGSSMHRVLKAAAFIKYNMPNATASADQPVLSDQEALDVAAFINDGRIHPRPKPKHPDYENLKHKPIDYFKGPYLDVFPDLQHAFGPWDEIEKAMQEREKNPAK